VGGRRIKPHGKRGGKVISLTEHQAQLDGEDADELKAKKAKELRKNTKPGLTLEYVARNI